MQEGFFEINPGLPFTKEGEISPSPSFIKRGVKGGFYKGRGPEVRKVFTAAGIKQF